MKNNYKFWFILSLIIIFILGAVGGAFFDKYISQPNSRKIKREKRPPHFPTLELMAKELELSLDQETQIRDIFKNNEERLKNLRSLIHGRLSNIRTQLITNIKKVLTDEQKMKFEAMIERYLNQRKKEIEKRKKHSKKLKNEGEVK